MAVGKGKLLMFWMPMDFMSSTSESSGVWLISGSGGFSKMGPAVASGLDNPLGGGGRSGPAACGLDSAGAQIRSKKAFAQPTSPRNPSGYASEVPCAGSVNSAIRLAYTAGV